MQYCIVSLDVDKVFHTQLAFNVVINTVSFAARTRFNQRTRQELTDRTGDQLKMRPEL